MTSRRPALVLAVALAASFVPAAASVARAETVETRQSSDVFATPGEQSRVVTRVRAGVAMTVLQRSGRWLKVRVNGRTGWVPRSVLATGDDGSRRKKARRFVEGRSTDRDRGRRGAPRDRVGADVVEGEEGFIEDEARPAERTSKPKKPKKPTKKARPERDEDADDDDEDDDDEIDDEVAASSGDDDEGDDGDEDEDDDEPRRETIVVVADRTALRASPTRRADEVSRLREGDRLIVIEREGDWVHVEDDDGAKGWVKADDVADRERFRYARWAYRAGAGLGASFLSQSFSSNSDVALGNYDVSSSAITVVLAGDLIYDYSADYLIRGDLTYRYGKATPGIRFVDPETMDAVDTGFQTHDLDLGASLGYKLGATTGMAAYGRLGYHYGLFQIANVSDFAANPARLPTEALTGVTIGAHLDIPRLTDKWAVRAGVDMMPLFARRAQTVGLEDGDVSDTFAMWGGLRAVYDWKTHWKASGELTYAYSKTSWTGRAETSMREHQATSAARKDGSWLVLIGVLRPF